MRYTVLERKVNDVTYSSGELAKLCGVSVRTVQYYDTRGILSPSFLSEGGRRLYSEEDVERMRVICYLRELDLPLGSIADLLKAPNSKNVISLILSQHEKELRSEIGEKQKKLLEIEKLQAALTHSEEVSLDSIRSRAVDMEKKKKLKKVHAMMILVGIPISVFQWVSIILWAAQGIVWPFIVWAPLAVTFGTMISVYYFKRVAYICPECGGEFRPRFKEAFFARHTPKTRRLTCPHCHHKGFCVETYYEQKSE